MSCQDMVPWPLVAPGEFDYYEERAGQGEIMVQAFDQNQQVGHGLQDRQGSHEFAQVSPICGTSLSLGNADQRMGASKLRLHEATDKITLLFVGLCSCSQFGCPFSTITTRQRG